MEGVFMDRLRLSKIDEELGSSEVEALCFLCLDVLKRKQLEGIKDARDLFVKLEEKGLLEKNTFLSHLLHTIQREDLVSFLETDSRPFEETDASPVLSKYRVMLYKIFEDMTTENLNKMKFLLKTRLPRAKMEKCHTALDVFSEMEKAELLSKGNVDDLHKVLLELDLQLASLVRDYKDGAHSHPNKEHQIVNNYTKLPQKPLLPISETEDSCGGKRVCSDAKPSLELSSSTNETKYYVLDHEPRGLCVVISNESFTGSVLRNRAGTRVDEDSLEALFKKFGFEVVIHRNLTARQMSDKVNELGKRNFLEEDALVVCVLSHGEKGYVYGTDEEMVALRDLTQPFTSHRAHTLAGKPKLFFIQACQGNNFQKGALPCPPRPAEEKVKTDFEEDAGRVRGETIPSDADFLLGMATVEECKSFRHVKTGSIYIQALCRCLEKSAESPEPDDILSILTCVNSEVSKGDYSSHKQMPEPKYTLTKKLVLRFV